MILLKYLECTPLELEKDISYSQSTGKEVFVEQLASKLKDRGVSVKKLALTMLLLIISLAGCAPASIGPPVSSATHQPSQYPADISGRVTIAETVNAKYQSGTHAGETMEMTPLEGQIYWIVDISIKNKSYENAVTAAGWKIVVDSKMYDAQRPFMSIQSVYPMTVPVGETGETTIRFPVPNTLKASDAKLCYQGQEPHSYGKLTGGDMVAVYDWDLKKVVLEEIKSSSTKPIIMRQIACLAEFPDRITVVLEPTKETVADLTYKVAVKKGDVVRATTSVSWTPAELQARQVKGFQFPTTPDEFQFYAMDRTQAGYAWKNLSKEFTVVTYTNTTSQIVEYVPVTPPFYKSWTFLWIILGIFLLLGVILGGKKTADYIIIIIKRK